MDRPTTSMPHVDRRIASKERRAECEAAKDVPAEHRAKLISSKSVAGQVHGTGQLGQFNTWLAVNITKSVGTMWAAYLFTLIAVGGAVAVMTSNALLTALSVLISQTFLQLVLLPIITLATNLTPATQDRRAEADHITLMTLHAINVQQ